MNQAEITTLGPDGKLTQSNFTKMRNCDLVAFRKDSAHPVRIFVHRVYNRGDESSILIHLELPSVLGLNAFSFKG